MSQLPVTLQFLSGMSVESKEAIAYNLKDCASWGQVAQKHNISTASLSNPLIGALRRYIIASGSYDLVSLPTLPGTCTFADLHLQRRTLNKLRASKLDKRFTSHEKTTLADL